VIYQRHTIKARRRAGWQAAYDDTSDYYSAFEAVRQYQPGSGSGGAYEAGKIEITGRTAAASATMTDSMLS